MLEEQELKTVIDLIYQIQNPLLKLIKLFKNMDYQRRYKHK